ncbi:hypothetical protein MKW94_005325 [Papaver nudicaule]|uniref:Uncharacterized protein n=1 Tax=Papaver nudicaule TaxID=74823 RepID=A0AA41VZX5_PAPNU|nr:hypothetical protein [Papaver nudicaule]
MCTHFTKDAFKNKSARGRKSAASKKINHSSGNKSHTSIEYELVQDGKPCDPLILFELTHDPEKMKSKFKENLKNMKGEMDKMKEAANKGEISDSPEEIYYKCRNAGGDGECLGKRRRKAPQTHYSLYQKKEKETAELKVRLAAVEKENKRLKKQTGPDAMKKWLNAYLAQQGMPLIELPVENDA